MTDDNELGHENWVIVSTHFELQLHFNVSNTMFSANGNTRFYLRPNNNEWEIAIWRDESNVY
ncbi:MAG: hypothetical protein B6226_05440 [Candidatus Cloacimonetes bacterium 4572_65]|nr:MAG: hypothetical protein B6226_05440 [Candidatus Cloacimonetes bacterium 4572_65]